MLEICSPSPRIKQIDGVTFYDSTRKTATKEVQSSIKLAIKAFAGDSINLRVMTSDLVENVKQQVQDALTIDVTEQKFSYGSNILEDDHCISDYSIQDGSTIHMVTTNFKSKYNCATYIINATEITEIKYHGSDSYYL